MSPSDVYQEKGKVEKREPLPSSKQGSLDKVLRVQNTSHVALLDTLEGKSRNQGGTDTRTVLGGQDFDGVLITLVGLGGPVQDLAQGLSAAGLEVRVLVEDGAVGADVSCLVALLLADSGDATGRKACGPRADELCRLADELKFRQIGLNVQLVEEEIKSLLEILEGITVGLECVSRMILRPYLYWNTANGKEENSAETKLDTAKGASEDGAHDATGEAERGQDTKETGKAITRRRGGGGRRNGA